MYSFIICFLILVASYFIYGKIVEKVAGTDDTRETPAYRLQDGIDYIPMSKIKNFLVHFLNIAGLGPIFGAIQGALFGPAAFLWIVFGTIFIGCVHDFFSGFMSMREDGLTMPSIVSKYLGSGLRKFVTVLMIITGILVAATFAKGAADLIANLTHIPVIICITVIFIYFLIATVFPVDKIMGKVYPIFGALLLIMAVLMTGGLLLNPSYSIPEFTTQGMYFTDKSIFPYLFVTIACGAISGFHASQSPIIARCIENENDTRPVFFGAMVLEGLVALCWAAIAMAFFHGQPQLAAIYGAAPAVAVNEMATVLSRLKLALPLFLISFGLTFVDFSLIWRYFAWSQLIVATIVLFAASAYLMKKKKQYIIALAPAVVCTLIAVGYILQAPEGLNLPQMISNIIAVIATVIITAVFVKRYKK